MEQKYIDLRGVLLNCVRSDEVNKRLLDAAVGKHGREALLDEIGEMVYHDLASAALLLALELKDSVLVRLAATVVSNSGGYSEASHKLAEKYKQSF